jgi:predicted metalloprotease with PDZ domain
LAYREEMGSTQRAWGSVNKNVGLLFSLGLDVGEEARVTDVVPGSAADKAGLAPGQKLVAVNGRKYSDDHLREAVKRSAKAAGPIELIVETDEFVKVLRVDYRGGSRNPVLERDESKPDRLQEIFKPRTVHPATAPAPDGD